MSLPSSWKQVSESRAYMMGLKRYAFRREYAAARLAAAGFNTIEFVDAFDGFEADVDLALKEMGVRVIQEIGKGHKGCIYTHIAAWKQMIADTVQFRVFFEDDVLGHLNLPQGLGQKYWEATPKDFDILYIGNMMDPLAAGEELVVQLPTYCTHAYILSLKGARRLLSLAEEMNAAGQPLTTLDLQLVQWQLQKKLNWQCWNGLLVQKSFPTFDEGLPWQFFQDIILPQKDTGLFWQNMRLGTTLEAPTLQLTIPQYSH